ncbi:hypothetical protein KEM55_005979 [Ascosphaera atra]|nr:hypothetical protein KEM55_005979 [Ascosphaera atra]
MKFVLLIRSTRESEAAVTPRPADSDKIVRYAHELHKAGILIDAQGLHPSLNSIRVVMKRDPPDQQPSMTSTTDSENTTANEDPNDKPDESITARKKHTFEHKGPFPPEQGISGWWIIDVDSEQEAVNWAKRSPFPLIGQQATVEIRQLYKPDDLLGDEPKTAEMKAAAEQIQKLFRG